MFFPDRESDSLSYETDEEIIILSENSLEEKPKHAKFTNIYDSDISGKIEAQFLIYSQEAGSLLWYHIDHPSLRSQNWSCNFWFYLIIYIHGASIVLGILHFSLFSNSNLVDILNDDPIEKKEKDNYDAGFSSHILSDRFTGTKLDAWRMQEIEKPQLRTDRNNEIETL